MYGTFSGVHLLEHRGIVWMLLYKDKKHVKITAVKMFFKELQASFVSRIGAGAKNSPYHRGKYDAKPYLRPQTSIFWWY